MTWKDLEGDGRKRFCGQFQQHVYNFEAMTFDDVMALLQRARQERVCMRLFRRADGTILTKDCDSAFRVARRVVERRLAGPTPLQWTTIGVLLMVIVSTLVIWASEAYARHVRRTEALGGNGGSDVMLQTKTFASPPAGATLKKAAPLTSPSAAPPPSP